MKKLIIKVVLTLTGAIVLTILGKKLKNMIMSRVKLVNTGE